eukprot:TRINITY_DN20880_c0_g1_i1.p1 TRINITY_DN20880_c0_g1~~TRINITY_DN20880_c0_g1_i1.p1  ORF type:complete len:329 (+),score=120.88 TRINITY_DN20880_c0_g1_i1:120-1106(+)
MFGNPMFHMDQSLSRWSPDRKHSPTIPVYVPPEMFRVGKGQAMEIFMLRAQFADMQRIAEMKKEDEWYARKRRREDAPVYNAKGERVNTPQNLFKKKRNDVLQDLLKWSTRVNEVDASRVDAGPTKKIYFTKDQMAAKTYAAILGARGKTHQELQVSTGCKITLMGRGISDTIKVRHNKDAADHRAGDDDDPHCHISAPDEESLAKCCERINFILSDKKEAVAFRDEKRRQLAILNGTYQEETWQTTQSMQQAQAQTGAMAAAPQRNTAVGDATFNSFLKDIEGGKSAGPAPPGFTPPPQPATQAPPAPGYAPPAPPGMPGTLPPSSL